MSLGGKSTQIKEEAYLAAIDYAESHNVIIVSAAGNNGGDAADITPANSDKIIAVTADLTADTEKKLIQLNANALTYKPYDIENIIEW